MTSTVPEPPAVPPSGDPEAGARFAAYLADLAAHVDDPECGEVCREILADDPGTQRYDFDLAEAMLANSTLPFSWFVTAVLVTLGVVAVSVCMFRFIG